MMKRFWSLLILGLSMAMARADFSVEVSGLTSSQGYVRALVFVKKEGFPSQRKKALKEVSVKASLAKGGKLTLTFKGVTATQGAVSVFHDQDSSGTLQKNLIGVPKEPVGMTGWDGKGRPKFEKCFGALAGVRKVLLHLP